MAAGRVDDTGFVSRPWVDVQADLWLASDDPVLMLSGPPGSGKTELARHLARTRPDTVYAHFCRARDDATLAPARFVGSLAQALAAKLPGYAAHLTTRLGPAPAAVTGRATATEVRDEAIVAGVYMTVVLGEASARATFDRMVRRPLEALAPATGPGLLVIVDALDEALTFGPGETLVHLLESILSPRPPVPLRFLLTTRSDPRVLGRLVAARVDLRDDAPSLEEDLQSYAEWRLQRVPAQRRRALAERIARAAAGNFLYARYVIDALLKDDRRLRDPSPPLPSGLDAHYREYLARDLARTDDSWEDRHRPLLGLLAVARGAGLSRELLAGAAGISGSVADDALRRLGQYVEGRLPEGPFRIYHQSFRDFLCRDTTYGVYPEEAESRLLEHLLRLTSKPRGGGVDWSRAPAYALTHLAMHAAATGALEQLLEDPRYLVVADPSGLLNALPSVTGTTAITTRRVYRYAARYFNALPPEGRAAYLEMSARCLQADHLADEIGERAPDRPWTVPWASWRPDGDFILGSHPSPVWSVAIGELESQSVAISGDDDGTLRIWDLSSGTLVGEPLTGHRNRVRTVAVGELDGRAIAVSGGMDGTLRMWDLAAGTSIGEPITGHDHWVEAVALGELDGRPIAVSGGGDGTLRMWDLGTRSAIGQPMTAHRGWVFTVALGHLNGRPIAVSGVLDGTLRLWDLATGRPVGQPLPGHGRGTGVVKGLAVAEIDGRPVAVSGAGHGELRMWDLGSGSPVGDPLTGHRGWVLSVAVGELHGRPVAVSGGADETVRVWDLAVGASVGEPLTGHRGEVRGVAAGELNGRPVAVSGGLDKTLQQWDLVTGAQVHEPPTGQHGPVRALAVGELDGSPVVVCGGDDKTLRVRDLATGTLVGAQAIGCVGQVRAVAIGERDGRPVALSGGTDKAVRAWDLVEGALVGAPMVGPGGWVWAVAIGEVDRRPISVSSYTDGTLRLWDLAAGTPMREPLTGHRGRVRAVAIGSFSGRSIAVSGGDDGTVRAWSLERSQSSATVDVGSPVLTIAVSDSAIVLGGEPGIMAIHARGSERAFDDA